MTVFIKNIFSKIPNHWAIEKFEKYIFFQEGPGLRNWQFSEKGIPFLNIRCIQDNGTIDISKVQFLNEEEQQKYLHFMLEENDTVISSSGSVGKTAIIKKEYLPLMLNTSIIRLRSTNTNKLIDKYMRHFINSSLFSLQYMQESQGSAQVNFGPTHLKKMYISVPPLEEQKKIADILSTVDKKIAFVEENINVTEELKKGLMQKLLTEGIGHTEFKDSELGRIPESWEIDKLENLTTKIGDGLHGTPKYVEQSDYYFINGNNLNGKSIEINKNTKCVNEEEYIKNKKILDNTTILLSINGTVGSLAYYNNENVMLGKSVAYMNVNSKILKQFLFYLLKSSKILEYFILELTGTTIKNLSLKTIRNTRIPLPPLEEQKQIAEILSTVDNKLENLKEKKQSFEELKKGLMQKLLTGEVRV